MTILGIIIESLLTHGDIDKVIKNENTTINLYSELVRCLTIAGILLEQKDFAGQKSKGPSVRGAFTFIGK